MKIDDLGGTPILANPQLGRLEKKLGRSWKNHLEHDNVMGILIIIIGYGLAKIDILGSESGKGTSSIYMILPLKCLQGISDYHR